MGKVNFSKLANWFQRRRVAAPRSRPRAWKTGTPFVGGWREDGIGLANLDCVSSAAGMPPAVSFRAPVNNSRWPKVSNIQQRIL